MNNNNNRVVIETPTTPPMTSPNGRVMVDENLANTGRRASERYDSRGVPTRQNLENLRAMRRALMSFNNAGLIGRRLNFNNMKRMNTSEYMKNKNRMKRNSNENKNTNIITWKDNTVKNLPVDPITTNEFNDGDKAVKINKLYLSPTSFRKMARMSMTSAINVNGNMILFTNPLTREKVKKGDLKFVVLKKR